MKLIPLPHTPEEQVSWFAIFAGLLAASLITAALMVYTQRGWGHESAGPVFLFSFAYAFGTGLVVGMPLLGRMARHRRLTAWRAMLAGAVAASFPGLLFVIFIASCANNPAYWELTTCTDGVRNPAGWGLSAGLIAALALTGALAALTGYVVYGVLRRMLIAEMEEEKAMDERRS